MSKETEELIYHALQSQPIEFGEKFGELLTQRITDRLADRKEEIAKTMFNTPAQADTEGN